MEWDWAFVREILPTLVQGVVITIEATLLGSALAMVLGLIFAVLRRTSGRLVSRTVTFLLDFVRGTPLLVQLYFLFYILPDLGVTLESRIGLEQSRRPLGSVTPPQVQAQPDHDHLLAPLDEDSPYFAV